MGETVSSTDVSRAIGWESEGSVGGDRGDADGDAIVEDFDVDFLSISHSFSLRLVCKDAPRTDTLGDLYMYI